MTKVSSFVKLSIFFSVSSTSVNAAWSSNTNTFLPAHSATRTISSRSNTSTSTRTRTSSTSSTSLSESSYTKGAEIFPLCNQREFTLADSFPNGVIPPMAQNILNEKAPNLVRGMELPNEVTSQPSRRNFILLASSALAATATASSQYLNSDTSSSSPPIAAFTTTMNMDTDMDMTTMNIPQAIEWIDNHCDRRFLHAVVASDYQFLYRGVPALKPDDIRMERPAPDLLSEGTYDSPQALELFQNLQTVLEKEAVNPSNGHLATASAKDAGAWGVAGSIWPVNGAHYAWLQDGGLFYPRPNGNGATNSIRRDDLIVDGKDCGRDSLEDALRSESCEVMVASKEYLVVPAGLDEKLREALKGSFLV